MLIRIHVVASYIHRDICEKMVAHAEIAARDLGAEIKRVTWIPGSLEAPLAVKCIVESDRPDAVVVFGVQERGQTKHGEIIAHQVTSKLLDLQIALKIPMAIAIIGPGATLQHAEGKAQRTSEKAIRAALDMVKIVSEISRP